jgi:hypothetical protein
MREDKRATGACPATAEPALAARGLAAHAAGVLLGFEL